MLAMLERKLFDLIEGVSRAERKGAFVRVLLESMHSDFAEPLRLAAVGGFRRDGARYERVFARGEELWDLMGGALSYRTLQRRLAGQLWYVERGLSVERDGATRWFDLILIPVNRELRHVLGFISSSMSGEEGQQRGEAFQALAGLIRLAVDRHQQQERLQEILTVARDQQTSLLPAELPPVPGYTTAHLAVPAYEVGGDYHRLIPLTRRTFAAAVADAKGHGFEAAVLVTALHAALRVVNATPFKVVHKVGLLNQSLAEQGQFRNLVSLFYGELDDEGRLVYVNCSHPPPLVVRSDGVEELTAGGMFLGLDAANEYRSGICELHPGDLLIAYTDGWTECFNDQNEEFGSGRLIEVVGRSHGCPPQAVVEQIARACDEFRGEVAFEDDRTLLVIRKE